MSLKDTVELARRQMCLEDYEFEKENCYSDLLLIPQTSFFVLL